MGSSIDKQAIFDADDLRMERVPVPEWPCSELWVKVMSGRERDEWETLVHDRNQKNRLDLKGIRGLLVVLTAADETGQRVFDTGDLEKLQEKNSTVLDRLSSVAMTVNGVGDTEMEELKKTYPQTTSNDSGSISQEPLQEVA